MNNGPYEVKPYFGPFAVQHGWCVDGPGLGGLQGIIPRSHDGMTQRNANDLAEILNRAWRFGSNTRASDIRKALGVSS